MRDRADCVASALSSALGAWITTSGGGCAWSPNSELAEWALPEAAAATHGTGSIDGHRVLHTRLAGPQGSGQVGWTGGHSDWSAGRSPGAPVDLPSNLGGGLRWTCTERRPTGRLDRRNAANFGGTATTGRPRSARTSGEFSARNTPASIGRPAGSTSVALMTSSSKTLDRCHLSAGCEGAGTPVVHVLEGDVHR